MTGRVRQDRDAVGRAFVADGGRIGSRERVRDRTVFAVFRWAFIPRSGPAMGVRFRRLVAMSVGKMDELLGRRLGAERDRLPHDRKTTAQRLPQHQQTC